MPQVVVTRVEQRGPPRRSRDLQERLMVRFPWAWRAISRTAPRHLSPRSRLWRALIRREVLSAYQATSRRDFELVEVRYAPDALLEFDPDFEGVGFSGPFRSLTEREKAFQQEWQSFEVTPAAVIDLGDRWVVLGSVRLTGRESGVELEAEVGQVVTARGGLVVRDQIFLSWERGLRAAGLDPDEIRARVAGTASQRIARWQTEPLRRDHRGVDERLVLAAPSLLAALVAAVRPMPPGSRPRRLLLGRMVRVGMAALNRTDEAMLLRFFHSEVDIHYNPDAPDQRVPDMAPLYRGPRAYLDAVRSWKAPFGAIRVEVRELFDAGETGSALVRSASARA